MAIFGAANDCRRWPLNGGHGLSLRCSIRFDGQGDRKQSADAELTDISNCAAMLGQYLARNVHSQTTAIDISVVGSVNLQTVQKPSLLSLQECRGQYL